MDLDTLIAVVSALGLREVAGQLVALWQGRAKSKLDAFDALSSAIQSDNAALRLEVREAKREARRANTRIDHMLTAIRTCPNAANCPALAIEDEDEDAAPVSVGRRE